jgi:hypothetical protein
MSSITPRFSEDLDAEVAEYRSLSGAAVGGLLLGLLSPAAFVDPAAWCIPFVGILVSAYALLHILRNGAALAGRKAALWGLSLSLCFAAAAPSDWLYYRFRLRQEAQPYAALWFDLIASGHPERAFQLSAEPRNRQPLDDKLWEYYRNNPVARAALDRYVAPAKEGEPPAPIRTLLALGKSAVAQYIDTPFQESDVGMEVLHQRYAVTFDDAGTKKTFFLIRQLTRQKVEDGRAAWKIANVLPGKKPEGS